VPPPISSGNDETPAGAISKLYQMAKEEREAVGSRGRECIKKYHSIPVLADKLESCLKEVME